MAWILLLLAVLPASVPVRADRAGAPAPLTADFACSNAFEGGTVSCAATNVAGGTGQGYKGNSADCNLAGTLVHTPDALSFTCTSAVLGTYTGALTITDDGATTPLVETDPFDVVVASTGVEARCTDLGADCVCSEPLNSNADVCEWDGAPCGPISSISSNNVKFTETPDATGCHDGDNHTVISSDTSQRPDWVTAASESAALPSGNALNYILHTDNGGLIEMRSECVVHSSAVSECQRVYIRTGNTSPPRNDYVLRSQGGTCGTDDNSQIKITNIAGGDGVSGFNNVQTGWTGDRIAPTPSPNSTRVDAVNQFGWDPPDNVVDAFNWDDCKDNYCRIEVCTDWDPGRTPGNQIQARFRFTALSPHPSPFAYEVTLDDAHTKNPSTWNFCGYGGGNIEPIEYYTQNIFADANCTPGVFDYYFTHAMAARKSGWNDNFWIGPACEVEGSCP